MEYTVTWTINLNADSPLAAAKEALRIQRDKKSTATVFDCEDECGVRTQIDLIPERN